MYYSPDVISGNAEMYQVTDEYAVYLDKDTLAPKGVIVEYYRVNFVEHHPALKALSRDVFAGDEAAEIIVKPSAKNSATSAIVFKDLFEKTLIAEALSGGHVA